MHKKVQLIAHGLFPRLWGNGQNVPNAENNVANWCKSKSLVNL